jgi:hydrogenase-4 component F
MFSTILILPLILALIAWWRRSPRLNYWLVISHAAAQLITSIYLFFHREMYPGYFETDAMGMFFFFIISILYAAVAVHNSAFLPGASRNRHTIYTICMLLFVASMDGVVMATNLGLSWVFIETTTLVSAVLIYHEQTKTALEAAWKYIFICSIGIALAFVGIMLLFIAQPVGGSLDFFVLYRNAVRIDPFWLKLSFVFLLCGFGTKLGLAPLHFWLPDAHSEAPAPVSALLSGALLNTALVPLLRIFRLMDLTGQKEIAQTLFILMGLLSIFTGAVFISRIKNFKRILAYSSIENMGIATLAFGVGGMAVYAGFLHLLGHSLVKAATFLTAGNIYKIHHNKNYDQIQGLRQTHPVSGWLWLICFILLAAIPPSPLFASEFMLAIALVKSGQIWILGVLLFLLLIIVYGLGKMAIQMSLGTGRAPLKLNPALWLPQISLLIFAALCGLYLMPFVHNLIAKASYVVMPY